MSLLAVFSVKSPQLIRIGIAAHFRLLSPPTLGLNALQKPTGDITDTMSIFFYSL